MKRSPDQHPGERPLPAGPGARHPATRRDHGRGPLPGQAAAEAGQSRGSPGKSSDSVGGPGPILPYVLAGERIARALRKAHPLWATRIHTIEGICRGVLPEVEPRQYVLVFPYGPLPSRMARTDAAERIHPFLQSLLRIACRIVFLVPGEEPPKKRGAWWNRIGLLVSRVDPRVSLRVLPRAPGAERYEVAGTDLHAYLDSSGTPRYSVEVRTIGSETPEVSFLAGFGQAAPTGVRWEAGKGRIAVVPLRSLEASTDELEALLAYDVQILYPAKLPQEHEPVPARINGTWVRLERNWFNRLNELYDAYRDGTRLEIGADEDRMRSQIRRLKAVILRKTGIDLFPGGKRSTSLTLDPAKRILRRFVPGLVPPASLE